MHLIRSNSAVVDHCGNVAWMLRRHLQRVRGAAPTPTLEIFAVGGMRALAALQQVMECRGGVYARRVVPHFLHIDQFGNLEDREIPILPRTQRLVLIAELASLEACRAIGNLCVHRRWPPREFDIVTALFPSNRFRIGWEKWNGRAVEAAYYTLSMIPTAEVLVVSEDSSKSAAHSREQDVNALAAPILSALDAAKFEHCD